MAAPVSKCLDKYSVDTEIIHNNVKLLFLDFKMNSEFWAQSWITRFMTLGLDVADFASR